MKSRKKQLSPGILQNYADFQNTTILFLIAIIPVLSIIQVIPAIPVRPTILVIPVIPVILVIQVLQHIPVIQIIPVKFRKTSQKHRLPIYLPRINDKERIE